MDNPALARAATAKEYFASKDWHNSGGDRTWLAPEVDFFFPNFPDLTSYFQPRGLDPGSYQVTNREGEVSGTQEGLGSGAELTIENELQLESRRAAQQLQLRQCPRPGLDGTRRIPVSARQPIVSGCPHLQHQPVRKIGRPLGDARRGRRLCDTGVQHP